jgi:hypothetical protein
MFHDSRLSHIIARASVSSDTMQNLEDLDDRRLNPEIREVSFGRCGVLCHHQNDSKPAEEIKSTSFKSKTIREVPAGPAADSKLSLVKVSILPMMR